jgi:hypothetical protein
VVWSILLLEPLVGRQVQGAIDVLDDDDGHAGSLDSG